MRGVEQVPWLYDLVMALVEPADLRRWREWLVDGSAGRVLDVGCGTGRSLPLFEGRARVVAIDPCPQSLRKARRRVRDARLVQARAEALPFRDGVFDQVTSALVFCSVADPQAGLRELRRVLRPAGALRMLEHVRSPRPWQARLQDLAQPGWTWLTGGCHPNRDTERSLAGAGFRIEPETWRAGGWMRRFVARPPAGRP